MNFEDALKALKEGKKVRRKGKAEYIIIEDIKPDPQLTLVDIRGHGYTSAYLIANRDILADDWEIVKDITKVPVHYYIECPSCRNRFEISKQLHLNCEDTFCVFCRKCLKPVFGE
jgi:Protein of unknown function (DUF2829)